MKIRPAPRGRRGSSRTAHDDAQQLRQCQDRQLAHRPGGPQGRVPDWSAVGEMAGGNQRTLGVLTTSAAGKATSVAYEVQSKGGLVS